MRECIADAGVGAVDHARPRRRCCRERLRARAHADDLGTLLRRIVNNSVTVDVPRASAPGLAAVP